MRQTKIMLIGVMTLLLVTLPLLGACGEKEVVKEVIKEVPVEKEVVKEVIKEVAPAPKPDIHIMALPWVTGPAAEFHPITWGFLDYFRDVNENGGIDGAKVVVHWIDTQYDVAKSVAAYSRFTKEHPIVVSVPMVTGAAFALMPRAAEDEIPLITVGGVPAMVWPTKPWSFHCQPNYGDGARTAMKYMVEQWKGAAPPKVGIAYSPNPYGQSCVKPVEMLADEAGYEAVSKQEVPFGALDATSAALAFKKAGVEVVYMQTAMGAKAVLCRDMERQGLEPEMIFASPQAIDTTFPELAAGAGEGVIAWAYFDVWPQDMDNPSVKYWRDKAALYRSGPIESDENPYNAAYYFWGANLASVAHAGLLEAAKAVGAENITAKAVRDGLEKVDNWQLENNKFQPPLNITPDDHRAYTSVGLMQVKDGKWVRLAKGIECPPVPDWEKEGAQ